MAGIQENKPKPHAFLITLLSASISGEEKGENTQTNKPTQFPCRLWWWLRVRLVLLLLWKARCDSGGFHSPAVRPHSHLPPPPARQTCPLNSGRFWSVGNPGKGQMMNLQSKKALEFVSTSRLSSETKS